MITTGNGNKSNVFKSGCFNPTRFSVALWNFVSASALLYDEIVCFKPFSAASRSPHKRSGYNRFNTIITAKLSNPCDLIGTFINDVAFDRLPSSQTLQICFCIPCGSAFRLPNEYSNANVGFNVSDRSRKLFIIVVLPLKFSSNKMHKQKTKGNCEQSNT